MSIDSSIYRSCTLCPRMCRVDRTKTTGFCGCGANVLAARAALHHWEEPSISGPDEKSGGSGAVFFSGCTLGCVFCQNRRISQEHFGKKLTPAALADIFLRLQDEGAYNINLVTATQFLPDITQALDRIKHRLHIPVVYNCGGYERGETVQSLADYVDIWLPDFKYCDDAIAKAYSKAPNYFATASAAIRQMIAQTGAPVFANVPGVKAPLLLRGVIIRHLVLPSHRKDSIALLDWISENLPTGQFLISLMSQYTPYVRSEQFPELNRRITTFEYNQVIDHTIALGLTQGYMQQKSSAKEEYTPPFDLEGV